MEPPRAVLTFLLLVLILRALKVHCDSDPPDVAYLPAELKVLDGPEYFRLQRTDRYLPGNASLSSRSETFLFLHHRLTAKPTIQATYLPFIAQQAVPADNSQFVDPAAAWDVRAVSIEGTVSPYEPYTRVLFHLQGQHWMSEHQALPCVTLHVFHQGQAVHRTCHLQAPLGVCVVELELPPHWFSPPPATNQHKSEDSTITPLRAELYYTLGPSIPGKPPGECPHVKPHERPQPGQESTKDRLHYVGPVDIRVMSPPRRQEVRLDDNVMVRVPDMALRPGQQFTATLILHQNFTADLLTLRIKVKKGLQVLAARPTRPEAWTAKLDKFKGSKHHTALVTCRRSMSGGLDWRASDSPEFLYLDFVVENSTGGLASTRPVTWQVEYPGQDPEAEKDKMVWEIQVSERDVRALVPLVKEQEIVNTALLSGIPHSVPVKLVVVETGGAVYEVTEQMGCESSNKQVLQVSDVCDAVYVGGKESRGARGVRVDFWYRRLHASLLFTVWAPLLPLRIELTDTSLEQVRGWRVTGPASEGSGPAETEDGGEEVEKKVRSCRLQYQRAGVRFLAHFVAHPLDGGRHLTYMPGSDWLLDVSHLVQKHARIQDPRVAMLEGGNVVIGREPGMTSVEVRSPVSDSILGEQTLVVSEEKVSISELRAQIVSGLSLALSVEPGHSNVFTATCQGLSALRSLKQEAVLSVWLEFSDHTSAPVELYGWREVMLSLSSVNTRVISVHVDEEQAHPMIVAEGPGRGSLLQLSLHSPDPCRKGKHRAPLAQGTVWLEVNFGQQLPTTSIPQQRDPHPHGESPFQRAEGAMSGEAVTVGAVTESGRGSKRRGPVGVGPPMTKFEGPGGSSYENVEQEEEEEEEEEEEDEMVKTPARVTDLEIGMYVLLGVFCLAIFIFLINCVIFVLRYQRKEPPDAGSGTASSTQQPHNWVWLGTDQEELNQQLDLQSQHCQDQSLDPSGTSDGCCCCTGPEGRMEAVAQDSPAHTGSETDVSASTLGLTAPGSPALTTTLTRKKEGRELGGRRKRVEFVTFATPPGSAPSPPPSAPAVQSILVASEDDIRWVCEDMGLRDPDELRSYMERIRGSS